MRCDLAALSAAGLHARVGRVKLLGRDEVLRHEFRRAAQFLLRQGCFSFTLRDQRGHGRDRLLALTHEGRQRGARGARLALLGLGAAQLRLQRLRVHAGDLVAGGHEVALAHAHEQQTPARLGGHVDRRGLDPPVASRNAFGQPVGRCPTPSHDNADADHDRDRIGQQASPA